MRDGFLMIKEVSLCVCVCVLVGGLMERVRDSRNDKSMEVLKQEIMKWRERERGRGETCASQGGQSQGESVVHLQLIHAFLPLCSKGAARRARPCVCAR